MDSLAALRLLIEWGADEALGDAPISRWRGTPVTTSAPPPPVVLASTPGSITKFAGVATIASPAEIASLATIATLYDAWAVFDGCALRATATSIVRPSGRAGSSLLLLGDAPGADDDRSGQAFSGAVGIGLDRVLASIGIDRSRFLAAHLVPWRPPGNRPPSEAELRACLPYVHRLIQLSGASHCILMGQAAARMLLATDARLGRLRGRWQDMFVPDLGCSISAMVMAPAEAWLRTPASRRETWSDLLLLASTVD